MKRRPTSTYRLQLHAAFRFQDAQAVVPYLRELGVTEVYTSPILKAEKGSTHGYNVVDHGVVSEELGGEEGFRAFSDALRAEGLGLVVDIVPNHMGIASGENVWWNDVLENGPSSLHADSFDVAWNPPQTSLANKVLYPILGAQYGEVLENGDLVLSREGGSFLLRYFDHTLPVAPRSVIPLLERAAARLTLPKEDPSAQELSSIVTALRHLPQRDETDPEKREERAREKEVVKRRLDTLARESQDVAAAVDAEVVAINGKKGDPRTFDALDALLLEQNYRLAFWRVATEEINYRRFFDVNQLAAVRMEDPRVFDAAHQRVLSLVEEGRIDGLRLDHTDGLYDPADYFDRLRARAGDVYVVAEKILEPGEKLPEAWRIEGTTGYDALAMLNGVWIDGSAERALSALYQRFTGDELSFEEHVYRGKRAVIRMSFAGEINVLAQALESIAEGNRRSRDFTLLSLTYALRETMAEFPVYRTYIRPDGSRGPNDEKHITQAIRAAKRRNPEIDASVFDFVRDVLFLRNMEGGKEGDRESQVRWVMRFQQLTGPIMAKGVEDTAFYRYQRLVSLNEVGAHPGLFGTSPRAFHAGNEERRRLWPLSMVTLSTHDTKRGEDVRARLAVLSEIASTWEERIGEWSRVAEAHRETLDDEPAPSRADEYLFYQTALGSTPFGDEDGEAYAARIKRIVQYMEKAMREEKQRTSWLTPNAEYEAAVTRFIEKMMGDDAFAGSLRALARATAISAATTSLGATAVKLTMPGVPDTYQGTESWAFSLVDPDNRRPVDYAAHGARLQQIRARVEGDKGGKLAVARELLGAFADGAVKLYVTHLLLALRRDRAALVIDGDYQVLDGGPNALAFARTHDGHTLVTVAPRLTYELTHHGSRAASRADEDAGRWPVGDAWGDAQLDVPRGRYENVLTGEIVASEGRVAMRDVLRSFPVAVLVTV